MKFEVAYRTADGKMAETTIEVADRNAVYSELRRQGITPISLHEAGAKKRDRSAASGPAVGIAKIVFMFALLALAGDLGCSAGPTLVGFVSDASGGNLKAGIFAAALFPIIMTLCLIFGKKKAKK